jgi:lysylphosphatidylglycerol synthetase-like protein (DUF2156 family)
MDTLKTQIVLGLLSGAIILFMLVVPYLMTSYTEYNFPPWLFQASLIVLHILAAALIILGFINYRKGNTSQGITAMIFGLLWYVGLLFKAGIEWQYIGKNASVCLSAVSPF